MSMTVSQAVAASESTIATAVEAAYRTYQAWYGETLDGWAAGFYAFEALCEQISPCSPDFDPAEAALERRIKGG